MDTQNSIFGWIVGAVVVVFIIAGIWWFVQANPATPNGMATTTPNGAATTTGTGANEAPSASTEVRTSTTVNGVIASLANSSRFASLYTSSGVSNSVTGTGPFTVFVPADSAFANLSPDTLTNMSATERQRLVQYHIVVGKMLDFDAVSAGNHTALSKDALNFNVNPQNKVAYVGSGYVITQYRASNGIVYVISAVLVPPQTEGGSITP